MTKITAMSEKLKEILSDADKRKAFDVAVKLLRDQGIDKTTFIIEGEKYEVSFAYDKADPLTDDET